MDLEALVRANRLALVPAARAIAGTDQFSLHLPCALVKQGTVIVTSVGGLRGYLPCSTALASEPIERFLRLKEAVGFDAAFEAMSSDDEVGEEFVAAWDAAQSDLAGGVVCTLNDLVAMVEQARKGWEATPRKLLVVAVEGKAMESGLVSVTALDA